MGGSICPAIAGLVDQLSGGFANSFGELGIAIRGLGLVELMG